MTIFLLFIVVLYFGLLLIYTFNTIIISGIVYFLAIPASIIHYYHIKKKFKTQLEDNENDEDIL